MKQLFNFNSGDYETYTIPESTIPPEILFADVLVNFGMDFQGVVERDHIVRVDMADGKCGKKHGWYRFFGIDSTTGIAAGWVQPIGHRAIYKRAGHFAWLDQFKNKPTHRVNQITPNQPKINRGNEL